MTSLRDTLPEQLANCNDFWAGLGSGPAGDEEVPWFRSGIDDPLPNGVRRSRAPELAGRFGEVSNALRDTGGTWWVSEDSRPGTSAELERLGAPVIGSLPHLARFLDPLPAARDTDATVREVWERSEVEAWVRAWAPSSGLPDDAVPALTEASLRNLARFPGFRAIAAVVDGEVVAGATLFARDGIGGLYAVATVPQLQGRGYARAVTDEALRLARAFGMTVASLQATGEGLPLYESMGFERIAEYTIHRIPAASAA